MQDNAASNNKPVQEMNFPDVLDFLKKNIYYLAGSTVSAGVIALGIAIIIPDTYTATAKILPYQQASAIQSASAIPSVIDSSNLQRALIERFELKQVYSLNKTQEVFNRLKKATRIKSNKDGSFTIEIDDVEPGRAIAIANAYPDEIDKIVLSLGLSEYAKLRAKLEERMANVNLQLSQDASMLKIMGTKLPIASLSAEMESLERLAILRAQLDSIWEDVNSSKGLVNLEILTQKFDGILFKSDARAQTTLHTESERKYLDVYGRVSYAEASLELMKKRAQLLKLDEKTNSTTLLDSAVIGENTKPNRPLIVVLTIFAAMMLTILVLLFKEWLASIRRNQPRSKV